MNITKEALLQIIKEEVSNLKQEGMFDFLKKEKPPIDFRERDWYKKEKQELELDKEQQKRLDLAIQTTQQFLDQELSNAQRLEGFKKLRRLIGSLLDPGTDLDLVIKNVLREDDKAAPHKTVGDGLEDLWSQITTHVKSLDDDMSRLAAEENKKLDGQVENFLDDAKDFIANWLPNGD